MGQCSTLPADNNRPTVSSSVMIDDFSPDKKKRLSEGGRKESLDFNVIVTPEIDNEEKLCDARVKEYSDTIQQDDGFRTQTRDPEHPVDQNGMEAMDVEDSRDQAPSTFPSLPDGVMRARCYKLNLDSEFVGLSGTQKQQQWLGPFAEPPPYLTYSSSDDSSSNMNPTKVAIKTAQIFRGITVSRDGTILTQNARATRSNRGKQQKRGEKSRQAAKIDKAKDLVDESLAAAKDQADANNLVSLVIIGEYDDMKHLVRDGSKKLRDAEGLPDETLLAVNRPRSGSSTKTKSKSSSSSTSISRKRSSVSPNFVTSQRSAAMQSPEQVQVAVTAQAVSPPKLKSHPRDTRPTRREDRASMRMRLESCSDFMDSRQSGVVGNGDWSHAWNIWNCVGSGAVSPLQPSSPNDPAKAVFEGRESAIGIREGGVTGRAG